jgi:SMP-30/Gluconolactonase/LRE-like region
MATATSWSGSTSSDRDCTEHALAHTVCSTKSHQSSSTASSALSRPPPEVATSSLRAQASCCRHAGHGSRARPARGRTQRRAHERRRLRSIGPLFGPDDGPRRISRSRGALPARTRRELHNGLAGLTISNGIGWSPDVPPCTCRTAAVAASTLSTSMAPVAISADVARSRASPNPVSHPTGSPSMNCATSGSRCGAAGRSAEGSHLATLPVPVDRPTSCAFGGPDRATLFITTARHGLDEIALAKQPHAGRVFRVEGFGVSSPPCASYRGQPGPGRQLP